MNYKDPELRDRLAAEYVLGTLTGRARKRFDRLLMTDYSLRREVWAWEATLSPFAEALEAEAPPARLWQGLQRRLGWRQQDDRETRGTLLLWRGIGAFLSVCSLALASALFYQASLPSPIEQGYFAMFADDQAQPLWLVSVDPSNGSIEVRAISIRARPDKAFELWALSGDGSAPRSLGLLPVSGKTVRAIAGEGAAMIPAAAGLAISLEPPGGSQTGLPTGPVLYQASLHQL